MYSFNKETIWIIIKWILGISVAIVIVYFNVILPLSANKSSKQQSIEEKNPWEEEDITLYAIKYGIERQTFYDFLKDYNDLTDPYDRPLNSLGEKIKVIDFGDAIDQVSQKYNISAKRLSYIILNIKGLELSYVCEDYCDDYCSDAWQDYANEYNDSQEAYDPY